jgi:hypothetical protein
MTVDRVLMLDTTTLDDAVKRSAAAAIKEVAEAGHRAPDVAEEAPVVPSPLLIPPSRPVHPQPRPMPAPPRTVTAYTTSTGAGGHFASPTLSGTEVNEAIRDVVDKVVVNWWRSASELSRQDLMRSRPTIPPELDRTMLIDLSRRLDEPDVNQDWRYAMRDAFWEKIDRL